MRLPGAGTGPHGLLSVLCQVEAVPGRGKGNREIIAPVIPGKDHGLVVERDPGALIRVKPGNIHG